MTTVLRGWTRQVPTSVVHFTRDRRRYFHSQCSISQADWGQISGALHGQWRLPVPASVGSYGSPCPCPYGRPLPPLVWRGCWIWFPPLHQCWPKPCQTWGAVPFWSISMSSSCWWLLRGSSLDMGGDLLRCFKNFKTGLNRFLVGGFNPSEKYDSQLMGWFFPIYGKS